MTGRERGNIMRKFAALIEENIDELAVLESLDNGKPFKYSRWAHTYCNWHHRAPAKVMANSSNPWLNWVSQLRLSGRAEGLHSALQAELLDQQLRSRTSSHSLGLNSWRRLRVVLQTAPLLECPPEHCHSPSGCPRRDRQACCMSQACCMGLLE